MKTTKNPSKEIAKAYAKLDLFFPQNNDKWAITTTTITIISALIEEIMEAFEVHQLSPKAKYSIIQFARFREVINLILRDKIKPGGFAKEHGLRHLSNVDWDSDDDWEEKYIFVVKASYEELKKEGKV